MKTNDYGIFKTISGNRKTSDRHVEALAEAIERRNLLEYFPILVNENMEIIDGQHRLRAAIKLGYDVPYAKVDGLKIEDVMQLNTNSKSWGIRDFIDCWIELGKPDYTVLKDFIAQYDLNPSTAAIMLTGDNTHSGGISRLIKSGEFRANLPGRANLIAKQLTDLKRYTEFNPTRDRELIAALTRLHRNETFDFERLIAKLKLHNLMLEKKPSEKYYILLIEELYNFKNSKSLVELYESSYAYTK